MQCKKCKKFLPQDVSYCAYCGFALIPPAKRKRSPIKWLIIIIILIFILRAMFNGSNESADSLESVPTVNTVAIRPTETPEPTINLILPTPVPSFDAFVSVSNLNMRSGPSTKYEVIAKYAEGTRLEITGKNADASWFQVTAPDGKSGWVSEVGLKIEVDVEFIPVVE